MLRRIVLTLAAVANLLLLDQVVKAASVSLLKAHPPRVVVEGFLDLAYVENRGCAWGMFQGQVWPLAVFACVALVLLFVKRRAVFPAGKTGVVAELLLYAGIVGNLVDRVARGFVVDMFDFHWGVHHFPVFNVADVYISVAAGLLIVLGFLEGRRAKAAEKGKDGGRHGPA